MTADSPADFWTCPDCGTAMAADVPFCTICGFELKPQGTPDAPLQRLLTARLLVVLVAVAVIAILVVYLAASGVLPLGSAATPISQPGP